MIRTLFAAAALTASVAAVAEPFQDAQNRVWYLSPTGGQRHADMAALFDPATGYAYDQSGLRWATAAEIGGLGPITGQDFFARYGCTYSSGPCNPELSMWMGDPQYLPPVMGSMVFGGVAREPIVVGPTPFPGPDIPLQTQVYFYTQWEMRGLAGPQEDWTLEFGDLGRSGGQVGLQGEVTQSGKWVYRFVPAPGTLPLLGLGLLGWVVRRRMD